jgi:hypothetical protein
LFKIYLIFQVNDRFLQYDKIFMYPSYKIYMRSSILFGSIFFIVILAFQLIFYHNIIHLIFALQKTNNSNQLSTSNALEQKKNDNRTSIFNQSANSKANPSDLALPVVVLTPVLIAKDLANMTSSKIADFPLQEYSSEDILTIFTNLSNNSLAKVLTSVTTENLKTIFDKIDPSDYESILGRLNQQTQKYVIDNTGIKEEEQS